MKLINRQSRANEAAANWRRQYCDSFQEQVADRVAALGANPDPDAVDRIIGNDNWTRLIRCDECKEKAITVQLGEEPDMESSTANICESCLRKALALLDAEQAEPRGRKGKP